MKINYQTLICCLGLWFLLGQSALWAQENDATALYQQEQVGTQTFDATVWTKTSKDMKFSTKPQVKKIPKQVNSAPTPVNRQANPNTVFSARSLLLLVAVLLLIFVIYRAVAGNAILINKPIERRQPVALKDIETNLQEADVEGFLAQSLKQKDYRLAIRLYYLAIIKELSAKGLIDWKRDKTNGQYLRELRKQNYPQLKAFRGVTRVFEYVWYSNMTFDGGQFEEVRIDFNNLLQSIK
ncbi:MAG: DUF4129 domain-containing protein [Aureispira sp.]